jgi:hypothetical protein
MQKIRVFCWALVLNLFHCCLQGQVALPWELGHFLRMDRLGLVGRCWSRTSIAGIEVNKVQMFILQYDIDFVLCIKQYTTC